MRGARQPPDFLFFDFLSSSVSLSVFPIFPIHIISEIVPGVLQERVDHVWLNILAFYFDRTHFGVEREAYVDNTRETRIRSNVLVTNTRGAKVHKLLIVETKRFPNAGNPGWENRYRYWGRDRGQLQNYLVTVRNRLGNV